MASKTNFLIAGFGAVKRRHSLILQIISLIWQTTERKKMFSQWQISCLTNKLKHCVVSDSILLYLIFLHWKREKNEFFNHIFSFPSVMWYSRIIGDFVVVTVLVIIVVTFAYSVVVTVATVVGTNGICPICLKNTRLINKLPFIISIFKNFKLFFFLNIFNCKLLPGYFAETKKKL